MTKRLGFFVVMVLVLVAVNLQATTLTAQILLPDGNRAPFAKVQIANNVFEADANGVVVLDVPQDKKVATVNWLALSAELPIDEQMKFKNKLYFGAPYNKDDFTIQGEDIWEINKNEILVKEGYETQLFYDDSFANFVFRAKFSLDKAKLYNYLRFFFRLTEPGFHSYCLSFPGISGALSYFTRFEGNWDKQFNILEPKEMFIAPGAKAGVEYETVIFAKEEKIVIYFRATSDNGYKKIMEAQDLSEGAVYDGGFGIMSSFLAAKITELSLFSY